MDEQQNALKDAFSSVKKHAYFLNKACVSQSVTRAASACAALAL